MTGQDIPLENAVLGFITAPSALLRLTAHVFTSSATVGGIIVAVTRSLSIQMNPRTSSPLLLVLPSLLITFISPSPAAATGIVSEQKTFSCQLRVHTSHLHNTSFFLPTRRNL